MKMVISLVMALCLTGCYQYPQQWKHTGPATVRVARIWSFVLDLDDGTTIGRELCMVDQTMPFLAGERVKDVVYKLGLSGCWNIDYVVRAGE